MSRIFHFGGEARRGARAAPSYSRLGSAGRQPAAAPESGLAIAYQDKSTAAAKCKPLENVKCTAQMPLSQTARGHWFAHFYYVATIFIYISLTTMTC